MDTLLTALTHGNLVAENLLALSLVAALGLLIGHGRIGSVRIGVIGVLFAGLLVGHLGVRLHPEIMDFTRELGLILFVYTIGLQVGPGFFASFRQEGGALNLVAGLSVLLGLGITWAVQRLGGVPPLVAVGLYSGAVTNTPSLGAAQQALKDLGMVAPELASLPGVGYALAYPFGILGTILTMMLIRLLFRINTRDESQQWIDRQQQNRTQLRRIHLEVINPNLDGRRLKDVPTLRETGVVISRYWHHDQLSVAGPETELHVGDTLLAVGPPQGLQALQMIVGRESHMDLREIESPIAAQRVLVTEHTVVGRTLEELNLGHRYGIVITRIIRGEVELAAVPTLRLQFGDTALLVGEPSAIAHAGRELGNKPRRLQQPPILPIFIGLVLGVLVGSIPIRLPGFPAGVKLGLAGGPLIVAMLLARLGRVGPVIWYLPAGANFTLRELGITLFLACVGLRAGDGFAATFLSGGWVWMLWGALITVIPILVGGLLLRLVRKTNYLSLCGWTAGTMTDPPALAFAGSLTTSDAPVIAYATVYPFVMFCRVISAQILVWLLAR